MAPNLPLADSRSVGNFYRTTIGGTGTVFKITPSGTLSTLHSFASSYEAEPYAELLQATDGNFYGTTPESLC